MKEKKKKPLHHKIIILVLIVLIVLMLVGMAPYMYFCAMLMFEMFFVIPEQPEIKQAAFPFTLVYEYAGEERLIQDTMVYEYEGYSFALDAGNTRDWESYAIENEDAPLYYIDAGPDSEIYIYIPMQVEYYMDAPKEVEIENPYIYYRNMKTDDVQIDEKEIKEIGLKIIRWEPSPPIENQYR